MKPFKIEIEIPFEDIENLLCSGVESGSGYWARKMEPLKETKGFSFEKNCLVHGFTLRDITDVTNEDVDRAEKRLRKQDPDVHVSENDAINEAGKLLTCTPLGVIKALELMTTFTTKRHFAAILEENTDAETGDVFIQLCVFRDVIYG